MGDQLKPFEHCLEMWLFLPLLELATCEVI